MPLQIEGDSVLEKTDYFIETYGKEIKKVDEKDIEEGNKIQEKSSQSSTTKSSTSTSTTKKHKRRGNGWSNIARPPKRKKRVAHAMAQNQKEKKSNQCLPDKEETNNLGGCCNFVQQPHSLASVSRLNLQSPVSQDIFVMGPLTSTSTTVLTTSPTDFSPTSHRTSEDPGLPATSTSASPSSSIYSTSSSPREDSRRVPPLVINMKNNTIRQKIPSNPTPVEEDTPPQSTSATPMSQGNVYAFAPMTIKSKSLAISPPKHDMSRKEHPLSCHFSIRLIDSNLEDEMDDGLHISKPTENSKNTMGSNRTARESNGRSSRSSRRKSQNVAAPESIIPLIPTLPVQPPESPLSTKMSPGASSNGASRRSSTDQLSSRASRRASPEVQPSQESVFVARTSRRKNPRLCSSPYARPSQWTSPASTESGLPPSSVNIHSSHQSIPRSTDTPSPLNLTTGQITKKKTLGNEERTQHVTAYSVSELLKLNVSEDNNALSDPNMTVQQVNQEQENLNEEKIPSSSTIPEAEKSSQPCQQPLSQINSDPTTAPAADSVLPASDTSPQIDVNSSDKASESAGNSSAEGSSLPHAKPTETPQSRNITTRPRRARRCTNYAKAIHSVLAAARAKEIANAEHANFANWMNLMNQRLRIMNQGLINPVQPGIPYMGQLPNFFDQLNEHHAYRESSQHAVMKKLRPFDQVNQLLLSGLQTQQQHDSSRVGLQESLMSQNLNETNVQTSGNQLNNSVPIQLMGLQPGQIGQELHMKDQRKDAPEEQRHIGQHTQMENQGQQNLFNPQINIPMAPLNESAHTQMVKNPGFLETTTGSQPAAHLLQVPQRLLPSWPPQMLKEIHPAAPATANIVGATAREQAKDFFFRPSTEGNSSLQVAEQKAFGLQQPETMLNQDTLGFPNERNHNETSQLNQVTPSTITATQEVDVDFQRKLNSMLQFYQPTSLIPSTQIIDRGTIMQVPPASNHPSLQMNPAQAAGLFWNQAQGLSQEHNKDNQRQPFVFTNPLNQSQSSTRELFNPPATLQNMGSESQIGENKSNNHPEQQSTVQGGFQPVSNGHSVNNNRFGEVFAEPHRAESHYTSQNTNVENFQLKKLAEIVPPIQPGIMMKQLSRIHAAEPHRVKSTIPVEQHLQPQLSIRTGDSENFIGYLKKPQVINNNQNWIDHSSQQFGQDKAPETQDQSDPLLQARDLSFQRLSSLVSAPSSLRSQLNFIPTKKPTTCTTDSQVNKEDSITNGLGTSRETQTRWNAQQPPYWPGQNNTEGSQELTNSSTLLNGEKNEEVEVVQPKPKMPIPHFHPAWIPQNLFSWYAPKEIDLLLSHQRFFYVSPKSEQTQVQEEDEDQGSSQDEIDIMEFEDQVEQPNTDQERRIMDENNHSSSQLGSLTNNFSWQSDRIIRPNEVASEAEKKKYGEKDVNSHTPFQKKMLHIYHGNAPMTVGQESREFLSNAMDSQNSEMEDPIVPPALGVQQEVMRNGQQEAKFIEEARKSLERPPSPSVVLIKPVARFPISFQRQQQMVENHKENQIKKRKQVEENETKKKLNEEVNESNDENRDRRPAENGNLSGQLEETSNEAMKGPPGMMSISNYDSLIKMNGNTQPDDESKEASQAKKQKIENNSIIPAAQKLNFGVEVHSGPISMFALLKETAASSAPAVLPEVPASVSVEAEKAVQIPVIPIMQSFGTFNPTIPISTAVGTAVVPSITDHMAPPQVLEGPPSIDTLSRSVYPMMEGSVRLNTASLAVPDPPLVDLTTSPIQIPSPERVVHAPVAVSAYNSPFTQWLQTKPPPMILVSPDFSTELPQALKLPTIGFTRPQTEPSLPVQTSSSAQAIPPIVNSFSVPQTTTLPSNLTNILPLLPADEAAQLYFSQLSQDVQLQIQNLCHQPQYQEVPGQQILINQSQTGAEQQLSQLQTELQRQQSDPRTQTPGSFPQPTLDPSPSQGNRPQRRKRSRTSHRSQEKVNTPPPPLLPSTQQNIIPFQFSHPGQPHTETIPPIQNPPQPLITPQMLHQHLGTAPQMVFNPALFNYLPWAHCSFPGLASIQSHQDQLAQAALPSQP